MTICTIEHDAKFQVYKIANLLKIKLPIKIYRDFVQAFAASALLLIKKYTYAYY